MFHSQKVNVLLLLILSNLLNYLVIAQTQITFPGAPPVESQSNAEAEDPSILSLEESLQRAVDSDRLDRNSASFYANLLTSLRPQCRVPDGRSGSCGRLAACPYLIAYVRRINEPKNFEFVKRHICRIRGFRIYLCCPSNNPGFSVAILQPTNQGGFQNPSVVSNPGTNPVSNPSSNSHPVSVPTSKPIIPAQIPPSSSPSAISVSSQISNICGIANIPFIIGGTEVEPGMWPWLAAVGFLNGRQFILHCGGTLVTQRHVLTAAHCFTNKNPSHVRLGEHDLQSTNDRANPVDFIVVGRSNPGYDDTTKANDIEVLVLDRTVSFTDFIRPACLPTPAFSTNSYEGKRFGIVGWGTTLEGGATVSVPRFAMVANFPVQDCSSRYSDLIRISTKRQLCADDAGIDSCQGDSGGPLQYLDTSSGRYYVTGIVSFGRGCARRGYPGVYTRVDAYIPWLSNVLLN